jgi:putative DNA methylase
MIKIRKKLIEVALPLEAINKAAAREKSIRHGHPSTLHLWWARRPLAAARAVIFSQMVDDPSSYVEELKDVPNLRRKAESVLRSRHKRWEEANATAEKAKVAGIAAPEPGPEPKLDDILAEAARNDLFKIIEDLVLWENTTNEEVLQKARDAIWESWRRTCRDNVGHPRAKELFDRHKLPAFHDPFAGGGAIPLEAQRLGLEAFASDLNPVAVLINKAMIEIPPRFAGRPPVNPEARKGQLGTKTWRGAQGLAEDVRYYGQWMRDEAEKRIGHLYPKIEITVAMAQERKDLKPLVGRKLTVIAWLWARTVKSPNPAFRDVDVPLASTFTLSNKPGNEAWVEAMIEKGGYRFAVHTGKPKDIEAAKAGTKLARGANFKCVMSDAPIAADYIRTEGKAQRMGARLMAIVAEGERGRIFLSPTEEHEAAARKARPEWKPDVEFFQQALGFRVGNYGMGKWSEIFTPRQLVALTTFSDFLNATMEQVLRDAAAKNSNDDRPLRDSGAGKTAYAEAVAIYLALAISKAADLASTICHWQPNPQHLKIAPTYARNALPMSWDFAEGNPFSESSGNFGRQPALIASVLGELNGTVPGIALQADATSPTPNPRFSVYSTDPPYFDNIGYADMSDFFYVWLRRALKPILPDLFATVAVPKSEELVATPARHGGQEKAEGFFLSGMTSFIGSLVQSAHPAFPVTIYYAFKQAESEGDGVTASTGWETFLNAVMTAGMAVSGTWPVRTERPGRMRDFGSNALASSIVLVCRPRRADATTTTRRDFVAALQRELPDALRKLQAGNIAPVDLAQAAIGPGMAVFTRYAKVLDANGKPLSVRDALKQINETLDTALAEQEGDFDPDSRWALAWFDQYGFEEGDFGVAETLSKAKNTSVRGLEEAGILESSRGKVRLLEPGELDSDWDPATDTRLTTWEMTHHLIRALGNGETDAAELVAKLGAKAETARELAYRLYTLCERKKRAPEALAYNGLVQSWPELIRIAQEQRPAEMQPELI